VIERTLLLDTHALLWLIVDPRRIPSATRDLLADDETRVIVSAVSAFEIATKYRLGKMPEAKRPVSRWDEAVAELGAVEIPVTRPEALRAGALEWTHRDPFDRILVAQSIAHHAPLVTADAAMRGAPGLRIQW
jgi:PIN domain nuclease of toxin-antitoxin system